MAEQPAVRITGLRELSKAFAKVDKEIGKDMRLGFLRIAQAIASTVASKVPKRTGRAAKSYRARASKGGAGIAWAGPKAPYVPWLDFGGNIARASRPFVPTGRYLYPTISEHRGDIDDMASDVIRAAARSAGFEVRG